MLRVTAATLLALSAGTHAQDSQVCESYNVNTGQGTCGGHSVDVSAAICAGGYDASKCFASMPNPDGSGGTENYYFKGTPTGLPAGTSIQSDCSAQDFPNNGGVAVAQVYKDASGGAAGCYPAADVQGTVLDYAANADGTLASLTVNFNVHTDGGGTERDAFIQITCQAGGPTSNLQFSTIGDQGHANQYEIDTTMDCAAAGPAPPPPSGGSGSGEKSSETGWVLVGLLIGGLAAYFGAGYMYNWKVKGAEGGDRVPNKDFWTGLPGLVKEGFRFTVSKVKRDDSYTPL